MNDTPIYREQWMVGHLDAMTSPNEVEAPAVNLLSLLGGIHVVRSGLAERCPNDYVMDEVLRDLAEAAGHVGSALLTYLNFDIGRLDPATMDAATRRLVTECGGNPDGI